jgi:hypothetical protein
LKRKLILVRCEECNQIVGTDYKIIKIDKCNNCRGKRVKRRKRTEDLSFASVKKGPALDLGKIGDCYFRSSWERNFARWLTVKKVNWTFEKLSFTFGQNPKTGKPYTRKPLIYIPDFHDTDSDIIYEVKGYFRSQDKSKVKRLIAVYPDDAKKLKVVLSVKNKTAIDFYKSKKINILFIEDVKKEYKELTEVDNWE